MRISDWSSDVCSSDLCLQQHPCAIGKGMTCKTEVSLRVGSVLGCKGFPSPPGEHDQSCIRQGGAGLIMYRSGDLEINFRLVGEGFRGGAQHAFPGKA